MKSMIGKSSTYLYFCIWLLSLEQTLFLGLLKRNRLPKVIVIQYNMQLIVIIKRIQRSIKNEAITWDTYEIIFRIYNKRKSI